MKINLDELKSGLREVLPDIMREQPQVFADALVNNRDALRQAFVSMGFNVSEAAAIEPDALLRMKREAEQDGILVSGFGARFRQGLPSRSYFDRRIGRQRRTYLSNEVMPLADAWARALLDTERRDPATGDDIRTIAEKLNKATRAPTDTMTGEAGTSGGNLVPTIIAAEIYEETVERFVLQNRVEVYVSAAPLNIPRRTSLVSVSRTGTAKNITETAVGLGSVKLSPERVAALAYIEPMLAAAAAVGPARYVIGQISEAMAMDAQRCIVAGNPNVREPRGINTLPTAGAEGVDLAHTQTFDDTDIASRRTSLRKLYYAIKQFHRESPRATWIVNNDGMQLMASLNDMNQRPFVDAAAGKLPTFIGKDVVESSAILTATGSPNTCQVIFGDIGQYAWQESPGGLVVEQTTSGGEAWVSNTIGIRAVQYVDGAPVIPSTFGFETVSFS